MISGHFGVQRHHCGGGSMKDRGVHKAKGAKNSDWLAIPIMEEFHTGTNGIHTLGVMTWEARYGTQAHFIDQLCILLKLDLWALAREPRTKKLNKTTASTKTVPRKAGIIS